MVALLLVSPVLLWVRVIVLHAPLLLQASVMLNYCHYCTREKEKPRQRSQNSQILHNAVIMETGKGQQSKQKAWRERTGKRGEGSRQVFILTHKKLDCFCFYHAVLQTHRRASLWLPCSILALFSISQANPLPYKCLPWVLKELPWLLLLL